MRRMGLVLLVLVAGCSRSEPLPRTPGEAKAAAAKARDEVRSARERKDLKAAETALARAQKAADVAREFLTKLPITPADNALASDALAAAKEAKRWAGLAGEDARLAAEMSTLEVGTYRATRDAAVQLSFMSLARAARQAKARSAERPPRAPKESALAAADMSAYCGRSPLADNSPDWDGVASDMERMGADPPPVARLIFSLGFMLAGQDRLALYEAASIDARPIAKGGERSLCGLLRGVALSKNGYPSLALEETEKSVAAAREDEAASGAAWGGAVRVILAHRYLASGEKLKAAGLRSEAVALRADQPLDAFWAGEGLAASGKYDEAAAALEQQAAGAKDAWLAKKLAARARELRNRKAAAAPLFDDADFLCDVLAFCVADRSAEKSPQQLKRFVAAARWLEQQLAEKLP